MTPRMHMASLPVALQTQPASVSNSKADLGRIEEMKGKSLVVLFGSNMGTCEDFADQMVHYGEEVGMDSVKHSLDTVCDDSVHLPKGEDGLVLVITSTYNGQAPDNARNFDRWLETPAAGKFQ